MGSRTRVLDVTYIFVESGIMEVVDEVTKVIDATKYNRGNREMLIQ
jgi:hypothetical protein